MHIYDGVLTTPVLAVTSGLAAAGVAIGLRRMDFEHTPRVGMMASVFFVASLIHVPVPFASVHLMLPGLAGLILGWSAFPAFAVALFLQAILFGHGGLTALGGNILMMALPAVACRYLFVSRVLCAESSKHVFVWAGLSGGIGILLACLLYCGALLACGQGFLGPAAVVFTAHLPVMLVEGVITGWALVFVMRVQPELLGEGAPRGVPAQPAGVPG